MPVPRSGLARRNFRVKRGRGLPEERRWIGYGMGHFDLLQRADAYARIRSWLDDECADG